MPQWKGEGGEGGHGMEAHIELFWFAFFLFVVPTGVYFRRVFVRQPDETVPRLNPIFLSGNNKTRRALVGTI